MIDLSSLWAGPLCAHLLGLSGARVVKLESITRPDGARAGSRSFFDLLHGGHESVAIDFDSDVHLLHALLSEADVVLESSRPRALSQLGIDVNEYVAGGTIWASITAYGRDPNDAMRVGFGDDVAAGAGLVIQEEGAPCPVGDAIADPLAGVSAAAAVELALRGNRGCLLDVSMHDIAVLAAGAVAGEPESTVVAGGDGWLVRVPGGYLPVCEPTARHSVGSAPALGEHTESIRTEFC